MCSKPKVPKVAVQPPVQDVQAPDNINTRRRSTPSTGAFAAAPGSTLLTGPSGVSGVSTGRTLLGG